MGATSQIAIRRCAGVAIASTSPLKPATKSGQPIEISISRIVAQQLQVPGCRGRIDPIQLLPGPVMNARGP